MNESTRKLIESVEEVLPDLQDAGFDGASAYDQRVKRLVKALKAAKKSSPDEMDIHVWKKPGTKTIVDLYTLSVGKMPLCVDATIDQALASVEGELGRMGE